MGNPKQEPVVWQVIKLVKAVAEFDNEASAHNDAIDRNAAAELLGVKARFVVVKKPA